MNNRKASLKTLKMTKGFRAFRYKQRLLFTIIAQQKKGAANSCNPFILPVGMRELEPGTH